MVQHHCIAPYQLVRKLLGSAVTAVPSVCRAMPLHLSYLLLYHTDVVCGVLLPHVCCIYTVDPPPPHHHPPSPHPNLRPAAPLHPVWLSHPVSLSPLFWPEVVAYQIWYVTVLAYPHSEIGSTAHRCHVTERQLLLQEPLLLVLVCSKSCCQHACQQQESCESRLKLATRMVTHWYRYYYYYY
jgi:hypothetical protein